MILQHIDKAQHEGGEPILGGREASDNLGGLCVTPAVFRNVAPDRHLANTEVFGPVLAIIPFGSDEEAWAIRRIRSQRIMARSGEQRACSSTLG